MDEADYWKHLEFRVCREFAGLLQNHLRFLWCDGFIPEEYLLAGSPPRITGHAWIGGIAPGHQEQWKFTLILDRQFSSRSDIEWSSLLPPEDVTRWFGVDRHTKRLEIEPSAAVPDACD